MVRFVRLEISSPTIRTRLKRKYSVTNEVSLYTTSGISFSLLCLRSRTFNSFKLTKVSGRLVNEFSLKARVFKLTKPPISGGRVVNLLPYK
ncbi:hypothetical protein X975_07750, partial [Stegodyphus mimosarum]